jgi:hypothetical protein
MSLQVRFGGRTPVNDFVCVDEGQILTLQGGKRRGARRRRFVWGCSDIASGADVVQECPNHTRIARILTLTDSRAAIERRPR